MAGVGVNIGIPTDCCFLLFVVYIIIPVDGTEIYPENEPIHSRPKRDLLKNFVWVWDRVFQLAHDAFSFFKYRVFKYTDKSPYLIAPTTPAMEKVTPSDEIIDNPIDIATEINSEGRLDLTNYYEANFQPKVDHIGILAITTYTPHDELISTTNLVNPPEKTQKSNITTEVLCKNLTTVGITTLSPDLTTESSETTLQPHTTTETLLNLTTKRIFLYKQIIDKGFMSTEVPSKEKINSTTFLMESFTPKENMANKTTNTSTTSPNITEPTTIPPKTTTLAANSSRLATRLFYITENLTTVTDSIITTKKVSTLARFHQKLLNILTKSRNGILDPKPASVTPDNDLNEIA